MYLLSPVGTRKHRRSPVGNFTVELMPGFTQTHYVFIIFMFIVERLWQR